METSFCSCGFCDITVSFNSSSRAVLDSESASIIPMNELPSFFNRSSANEDNPLDNWSSNPPEATISGKFCALFNVARFEKNLPIFETWEIPFCRLERSALFKSRTISLNEVAFSKMLTLFKFLGSIFDISFILSKSIFSKASNNFGSSNLLNNWDSVVPVKFPSSLFNCK